MHNFSRFGVFPPSTRRARAKWYTPRYRATYGRRMRLLCSLEAEQVRFYPQTRTMWTVSSLQKPWGFLWRLGADVADTSLSVGQMNTLYRASGFDHFFFLGLA
jgi:hypothetical protein